MELLTPRLCLRPWQPSDLAPFAELNADARVMAFFPSPLEREQSDQMAMHCQEEINERGWGFWAIELRATRQFIGFAGLQQPALPMPFEPRIEVGWCLAHAHWRKGYATEAATGALHVAFNHLGLDEVVSFTSQTNQRSLAVMKRLGMRADGGFDHPALPDESPLRAHHLYRLTQDQWAARSAALAHHRSGGDQLVEQRG